MRKMMALVAGLLAASPLVAAGAQAAARDCPNGGTVRFGVEPFEAPAQLVPIYAKIGAALGNALDCKVQVLVATGYNAEIDAMRSDKLDIGEFGAFGYVLAHQVAHAEAVAAYAGDDGKPTSYTAGIVTWPGSGIAALKDVAGKRFAFSDPASIAGHLFPSEALKLAGIDPDKGIVPVYAGTHAAAFEAIRIHKVDAGELGSQQIASATRAGTYKPSDTVELWRSGPIPNDPITIRGTLPAGFRARATKVLQTLDFASALTPDEIRIAGGARWVPEQDKAYDGIRDLVRTLRLDLEHLE